MWFAVDLTSFCQSILLVKICVKCGAKLPHLSAFKILSVLLVILSSSPTKINHNHRNNPPAFFFSSLFLLAESAYEHPVSLPSSVIASSLSDLQGYAILVGDCFSLLCQKR